MTRSAAAAATPATVTAIRPTSQTTRAMSMNAATALMRRAACTDFMPSAVGRAIADE